MGKNAQRGEKPTPSSLPQTANARVLVENVRSAPAWGLPLTLHTRKSAGLEVTEEPADIRFRDRCGRSFRQYEGSWQIGADEKGTTIVYRLNAKPSFEASEFLLKRLLKRDARQMIERLTSEIAARS